MRITSGSYYNNIYGENNRLNKQLFDVNKQISSGLKIQYAHENPGIFIDTLRLDDELTTLNQVKSSAKSAYKMSTQTDTTIGDIVKTLESMKVKMVNAANDAHSDTSIQAIAKELRGLQNHLLTLANTSIGGQYLFSGTATSVKPIGTDGTYQGNAENLEAFLGSGIKQKYNISGSQLFSGDENKINRTITTNIPHKSLTDLYPDIMQDAGIPRSDAKETYITGSSTIRDLMGDTDADTTNDPTSHFYLQGTRHNGSTFKTHIQMNSNGTVDDLMQKIALQYDPNLTNPDLVNVSINAHGQIEIVDKQAGSSKLDFHMVGAVDFHPTNDNANVTNINNLQNGSTTFKDALDFAYPTVPPSTTANSLYIKEFNRSGTNHVNGNTVTSGTINAGDLRINGVDIGLVDFSASSQPLLNAINTKTNLTGVSANLVNGKLELHSTSSDPIIISTDETVAGNITTLEGLTGLKNHTYDTAGLSNTQIPFLADGAFLKSNVSQINKLNNNYADPSTKLIDVTGQSTLVGSILQLQGKNVDGDNYDIQINLNDIVPASSVSGTVNGTAITAFNIYNADATRSTAAADDVTYQQLLDVVNMIVSGVVDDTSPAISTFADYDAAITSAKDFSSTTLDNTGKIVFEDKYNSTTKAYLSIYDTSSNTYPASGTTNSGSAFSFNANNALTIRDPKTDFFAEIEEMIRAVEQGKKRSDGTDGDDPRNIGIQNAIQMMDDLSDHVSRLQTEAGSYSQVLQASSDRTDMLIISTKTLQSDVIDTDIAEATLRMQQLSLNYQALLSNISKVSKLSLVNYL